MTLQGSTRDILLSRSALARLGCCIVAALLSYKAINKPGITVPLAEMLSTTRIITHCPCPSGAARSHQQVHLHRPTPSRLCNSRQVHQWTSRTSHRCSAASTSSSPDVSIVPLCAELVGHGTPAAATRADKPSCIHLTWHRLYTICTCVCPRHLCMPHQPAHRY